MAGDLDSLVEMGFDREKSEIALKKGGNLTGAIDWLDKNSDKSIEDLKAAEAEYADEDGAPKLEAGEQANSMVCNECGKKFRSMAQAQFHAEKSQHTDFSESTEEIAPLTEDERKLRLEELRAKLAAKRAGQAAEDKLEQKRNEEIRKKHTKEHDDAKEELQRKEQMKEAQKKKQEKADDLAAKKRIREKIEADKLARKRKAEEEKAMRNNPEAFNPGAPQAPAASGLAAVLGGGGGAKANHSEARLKLQTPTGTIMKTLPAETTLHQLCEAIEKDTGCMATVFSSNFPRKEFTYEQFGLTLKEAGWVPSAMLNVS